MKGVSYTLEIAGEPADSTLLESVKRIEVESHAQLADMMRLRLAISVNRTSDGWDMLDDDLFNRLTEMNLWIRVGSGEPVPLINAYVIEVRTTYSNDPGHSFMDVIAMDATVLMNLEQRVRAWPNMADGDIASSIFGDHGLTPDVETTEPTRQEDDTTVLQRDTDIQFLRQLAARNGFEVYVETNPESGDLEGHFHLPRLSETAQGVLSVNLGSSTNVNSFAARYDMIRPAQAMGLGVDIDTLEIQRAEASGQTVDTLGDTELLVSDRPRQLLLAQSGLFQTSELQNYAQAIVDRSGWAITAEGELNTVTYGGLLRAKRPVMVRGVGSQFSGAYYVDRVLHVITADSYVQQFQLNRNAVGVSAQDHFTEDLALPA